MTATLLTNELSNLIGETSKRKNGELRVAAEKALEELKALPSSSEQQLAADLIRRPAFIEPFVIACKTRSPKIAASGVICLQRLVISKSLPYARLSDALDALNACTDLGLDLQLKILQALPSLLQNYAGELKGDLLAAALQVCASLQSSKVQTVSGVAAATLQQLTTVVFEKAAQEGRHARDRTSVAEVPGNEGPIALLPAAHDAYRVFRDLALTVEGRKTKFVDLSSLSPELSLKLIWSSLEGNRQLFDTHPELSSVIRSNLLPFITRSLSEKFAFPVTVRSLRILDLIIRRSMRHYRDECEVALGLIISIVDSDAIPSWKRALLMEINRNIFSTGALVLDAYVAFDLAVNGKSIVQDLLSAFVRISAEKPATIGLGQQSTLLVALPTQRELIQKQASVEAGGGMAGVISSALGVADSSAPGISLQWGVPRTACLDQLDKTDPPTLPDTYIYTLILDCLGHLSDVLAKVILPLSVQHGNQPQANGHAAVESRRQGRRSRSQSARPRAVPANTLKSSMDSDRPQAVAALIENCWPAVLATSSTFLNAALDDQHYRNLIKAYQRFAQVAGLLRLTTARDALMTTLSKSAVPPHILNAAVSESAKTPSVESPRIFSNPKSLVSVDSLVSQSSTASIDRDRRSSIEPVRPMLNTRNLLCLRALLNLAIALGPTLDTAFPVVIDALRQADVILSTTTPQQLLRQGGPSAQKGSDSPTAVQTFSTEVAAVEAAASRLLESTADFPNHAFITVLDAFCGLLSGGTPARMAASEFTSPVASPPSTPLLGKRTFSGFPGISTTNELHERDYRLVLPKLGTLAELNVPRFASYDAEESGWSILASTLTGIASSSSRPKDARRVATEVLCKLVAELVSEVSEYDTDTRILVQRQALALLLRVVDGIYSEDGDLTSTDVDIHNYILDALRSILERSGDSLVAGWNKIVAIISSAFERTDNATFEQEDDDETYVEWSSITHDLVSVNLGRIAFAASQLICSDFIPALPSSVMPSLIEVVFRFIRQTDDINVALTAVTTALTLLDFLFSTGSAQELDQLDCDATDTDEVEAIVQQASRDSRSAQWLFLLLRLRDAVSTTNREIRNAAFYTICNSFKNQGSHLTLFTWDLTLRSLIFSIVTNDAMRYMHLEPGDLEASAQTGKPDEDMSKAIITGTAEIIAQHIRLIQHIAKLPSLWEVFLSKIEAYLDASRHQLHTAAYSALARVLSSIDTGASIWAAPTYRTLSLWSKRMPEVPQEVSGKQNNQDAYVAYVNTARELYRLTQQNLGTSHLRNMIDNLYLCIRQSTGPQHGGDINNMSVLQIKVLELLRRMGADLPHTTSTLITVAAQLSILHHDSALSKDGPSFVAAASEAIGWLQQLLSMSVDHPDLLDVSALLSGLQSLRRLIEEKYMFPAECKEIPLWRKATEAALELSEPVLQLNSCSDIEPSSFHSLLSQYVAIAGGIVNARGIQLIDNQAKLYEDQLADLKSFQLLRTILPPKLNDSIVPDSLSRAYCHSLFEASIIHATEASEIPKPELSPLQDLGKIRRGRGRRVAPSPRERMCYKCFSELVDLASENRSTPRQHKLAQAAAPFLVLRLAIPIRAYIADQPLRGRRPQPLSELEELLGCFDLIQKLQLDPDALAVDSIAAGRSGKKAHLFFLYPLLAKAVATAGDRWSGSEEVLKPLQSVLETIILDA